MQVTREVAGKLSSPRESENEKAEKRCGHKPLLRQRALIDPTALGEPERDRRPHVHRNGKQVLSMALFFGTSDAMCPLGTGLTLRQATRRRAYHRNGRRDCSEAVRRYPFVWRVNVFLSRTRDDTARTCIVGRS